jgi:hypothetical protein
MYASTVLSIDDPHRGSETFSEAVWQQGTQLDAEVPEAKVPALMSSRATWNAFTSRRRCLRRVNEGLGIGVVAAACILDASHQSGDRRTCIPSPQRGRVGVAACLDTICGAVTTSLECQADDEESRDGDHGLRRLHHSCENDVVSSGRRVVNGSQRRLELLHNCICMHMGIPVELQTLFDHSFSFCSLYVCSLMLFVCCCCYLY